MKCDLCQGNYRQKAITLSFQRQGKSMVVENVPGLVCDLCGDRLLSESTTQQIERLLSQEPQGTAPLYRFPQKVSRAG